MQVFWTFKAWFTRTNTLRKNVSEAVFELVMISKPSSALLRGLNKPQENVRGELILPNTFAASTKANMMQDKTPGSSCWETTFSEAVVKKCKPEWENRCKCNAVPGNPTTHHTETQLVKGLDLCLTDSSLAQNAKQQPKKEQKFHHQNLCLPKVLKVPRKSCKNSICSQLQIPGSPSTPLTQGGQAAALICSSYSTDCS